MVGGIRKHAGLQADGVTLAMGAVGFAEEGAIHEVAGIELDARRTDAHFHHPARNGVLHHGGRPQTSRGAFDNEVMVVTAPEADLLILGVADAVSRPMGCAEVEWRARHGAAFAG